LLSFLEGFEMIESSESIVELAVALAKFHADCPVIVKDTVNGHFKNKYADLGTILREINPVLAKHGLSVLQIPFGDFSLATMLLHSSGQFMRSVSMIRPTDAVVRRGTGGEPDVRIVTPQAYASALTYQRRYALAALLSLCIDDDDDGNAGSEGAKTGTFMDQTNTVPKDAFDAKPETKPQPPAPETKPEKLSETRIGEILTMMASATEGQLPKMEQSLNTHGIQQTISKSDWAMLAATMLSRAINVASSPAELGKIPAKLAAYRSKGLLAEDAFASLSESLAKRTEEMKG
jgi:hypothetical protein